MTGIAYKEIREEKSGLMRTHRYSRVSVSLRSGSVDIPLIHVYVKQEIVKIIVTGMVLIDLQKVFDTIDHCIIFEKNF